MAELYNRVAVLTATTGTGTVTLGGAVSAAFCTFAEAGAQDGDVITCLITEGGDFELFRGTYTASGTTLSRDDVLLSKIGGTAGTSKMNLAGSAEVRIAIAAEDLLDLVGGGDGDVTASANIADNAMVVGDGGSKGIKAHASGSPGSAAFFNIGTGAGTAAAGDDARFPVMPHDFTTNVGIGNATKDTEALQAWAAEISNNNVGSALLAGKKGAAAAFRLEAPLIIGPSSGTIATRLINCNASIKAVAPIEDMVWIRSFWSSSLLGKLAVEGTGGQGIVNNTCINGFRISSAGGAHLGFLHASNLRGWGFRNTGGNVHFASIQKLGMSDCGSRTSSDTDLGRGYRINVTDFDEAAPLSVLTIDDPANIPPATHLLTWGWVRINGYPYRVMAVNYDLGTISVWPYVTAADAVPGEYNLIFGGGLRLGGQSAQTAVDALSTNRCGTSCWLHGVGTPVVKGYGTHFDAVGIVLGDTSSSVFGGATVTGAYFENVGLAAIIHVPQTSSASNGSLISGITALPKHKIFSPATRHSGGVERGGEPYFPVELRVNNRVWFPWSEPLVRNATTPGALSSYILSNEAPRPYTPMRRPSATTFTINLVDEPIYRALKGSVPVDLMLVGRGARKGTFGGYNGNIVISAQSGYTINDSGFQSLSITGPEKPSLIRAWLEDDGSGPTIWRVTIEELNIFAGTEANPVFPGNITDLDVVASTPSSLTVEFTEADDADSYEYRQSLNNTPGAWGGAEPLEGSAASGTFTGTVEGLDANEVYDLQVRGVNDNGPGEWSNIATGSTVIAPSTITDLTVPRTTISSAIVRFSPSINAETYEVRHSVTTENDWTEDDLGVLEVGALLEGEVEGLEEDETYDFQVRGVIGDVVGEWSNLVTATAEVTFPGDIDDLDIVATTYESFTLEFTEATNADLGYQARYSVETLDEWTEVTLSGSVSGGVFTGDLVGLSPGVTYDVQVRGLNAEGPGEWSNLVTDTARALLHYQIDTFTASGTWTAPDDVELVDYAEGWAAGGGSSYDSDTTTRMSGGGSAYARTANIEVTPETGYTVTVADASAADTDGGDSSFIDGSTLLVKGGKAGINGRTGGQASECVGDVKYDGGTGNTSTSASTSGGGAAGDQEAASGIVGGDHQGPSLISPGTNRCVPGGGAGASTSVIDGARGEIRIHYKRPVPIGFPPVVSRNWGREKNTSATHPINMPPSLAADNLLLAWVVFRGSAFDPTIPGDWTVLADVANGTSNRGILLYKYVEGGDSLTIGTGGTRCSHHYTWQIATAGVPTVSTATGSGATNDPPSHTPAAGSDKYLWLALMVKGSGQSNYPTIEAPTNYGSFNHIAPSQAVNSIHSATAERFLEASSENPAAFTTASTAPWTTATVAIPFVEVEPPAAESEFLGTVLSTDNLTTYTFTGVPFGTATEDRRIIIPIGGGGNTNAVVTAASIGGHTADIYSMTDSASRLACATISALVPAGTTGTVTVTFAAAQQRCSLHVHRARKLQSGVPVDWVADHAHATVMEANLEAENGGFIIAGSMYGNTTNTNHHVSCASRAMDTTGTKETSVERTAIDNVEWSGLDQDSDVLLEAHDTAIGNFVTLAATSWR